jgi:ATPase family associated with various cellular activities (AAA)
MNEPPGAAGLATARPGAGSDASLSYVFARLSLIEERVRIAVARRRAADNDPGDRFRGLYISEAKVDELLGSAQGMLAAGADAALAAEAGLIEARADQDEAAGADLRLRRLRRSFGLDQTDVDLLLVCLAPDIDVRFERLYGYLHDDVSRRRASIGLALELTGLDPLAAGARRRLAANGALVAGGLVIVEEPDRPMLTRSMRVPDRVAAHVLGDDRLEAALAPLVNDEPILPTDGPSPLANGLAHGVELAYVREQMGSAAASICVAAFARLGRRSLTVDLERLDPAADPQALAVLAVREARLRDAGLICGPIDGIAERSPASIRTFAEGGATTVLHGMRVWDPAWSNNVPLLLDAPLPTVEQRRAFWSVALDTGGDEARRDASESGAPHATMAYRLTPAQVFRAAQAARKLAVAADRALTIDDLRAGARAQNAAGLDRLARRITPRASWADLVLPTDVVSQLHELTARARHRDWVYDSWGIGGRAVRGRGVTALFAGDSGTGKTMSAEVVAGDLGLELYVIDLSTVVDKYIGETEKNLDRVFREADRVNGVLLFDEADAIFGKRSEVKDARDRYANIEIAYLLQRMESFDGLAILTTNLRANVDDAFTRRLDAIIDYPIPEEDDRRKLWQRHLPPTLPQADDIDVDFLARAFKLAGGNIRNVCVTAAFLAAEEQVAVSMSHLIRGTQREYRKMGRLTVEAEFGPYLTLGESGP